MIGPGLVTLGLDLSLTHSGVAAVHGDGRRTAAAIRPAGAAGAARLKAIRLALDAHLRMRYGAALAGAAIEGYSYDSKYRKGSALFQLGELGGVARLLLYERGVDYIVVSPATAKKWNAGNGNANKARMVEAYNERYGTGYAESEHNEVDALVLAEIAWWHFVRYPATGDPPADERQRDAFEALEALCVRSR